MANSSTRALRLFGVCALMLSLTACNPASNEPPLTELPYSEDFSNTASGWEVSSDLTGETAYRDGQMQILVKNDNFTIWSFANKSFKDAIYEVDAAPISGPEDNGFGVVFRYKDRKNFLHFEISSDGYWRAGTMKEGKFDEYADWVQHPAIKTGNATNRIRIEMRGDEFVYAVNGTEILRRSEPGFERGDLGVFVLTVFDQPNVTVGFDNVSVIKP
jgi:hypothetical protein